MSTRVMLSLLQEFALLVATMPFWLTVSTVSGTVLPRLLFHYCKTAAYFE